MKVTAAFVALAAVVAAVPAVEQRDVSPESVTAALLQVLPSSIIAVAITNPGAATTLIEQAFATGTPAWFSSLPSDVQQYLITAEAGKASGAPASASATPSGSGSGVAPPLTTGSGNGTASTTGKYSNSTTTKTGSSTKTATGSGSESSGSSSSSSAGASMPTAIIGGGIAGFAGLLAMLAL
jgi:hypothetical protein